MRAQLLAQLYACTNALTHTHTHTHTNTHTNTHTHTHTLIQHNTHAHSCMLRVEKRVRGLIQLGVNCKGECTAIEGGLHTCPLAQSLMHMHAHTHTHTHKHTSTHILTHVHITDITHTVLANPTDITHTSVRLLTHLHMSSKRTPCMHACLFTG